MCSSTVALLALGALTTPTSSVPSYTVNLDHPPELRWKNSGVIARYRPEMIAMATALQPVLKRELGDEWENWQNVVIDSVDDEYKKEMQGIVDEVNHPKWTLKHGILANLLYELQSPTWCSGVLWVAKNGTVVHGRNLDYAFHFPMPDGRWLNLPDVTLDVTFTRGGKPMFVSTQFPGSVGIHTGMRFNGWSFQQNTREAKKEVYGFQQEGNNWQKNLKAAKQGGKPFSFVARKLLETTDDFSDAINALYAERFMAPMYMIVAGKQPWEGAVLSLDRLGKRLPGTPPLQVVSPSPQGWHLVQTNDDLNHRPLDWRRSVANFFLNASNQDIVNAEHMMEFLHTPLLFNDDTVLSTVMVPRTGHYKTALPYEPPGPLSGATWANSWQQALFQNVDFASLGEAYSRHQTGQKQKPYGAWTYLHGGELKTSSGALRDGDRRRSFLAKRSSQ